MKTLLLQIASFFETGIVKQVDQNAVFIMGRIFPPRPTFSAMPAGRNLSRGGNTEHQI